ncbi:MAG TPA: hypothetical protein VJI33_03525 [Candidatus Paceibacterota bacterium]
MLIITNSLNNNKLKNSYLLTIPAQLDTMTPKVRRGRAFFLENNGRSEYIFLTQHIFWNTENSVNQNMRWVVILYIRSAHNKINHVIRFKSHQFGS